MAPLFKPLPALFIAAFLAVACGGRPQDTKPHRLGVYLWSPTLSSERWAAVVALEPDDIYVKAGSVFRSPGGLRVVPPVVKGILATPKNIRVHAVFHHTVSGPGEKAMMPALMANWLSQFQASLGRGGLTVSGIQLDLEGDWDLKAYPDLMARLPLGEEWARSVFVLGSQVRGPEEVSALEVFDQVVVSSYDFSWDQLGFRPTDIPWTIDFIKRNFPNPDRVTLAAATYGAVSVLDPGGRARIPLLDISGIDAWKGLATPMGQQGGRALYRAEKDMDFKDVHLVKGETLAVWQPSGNRVAADVRRGLRALPGLKGVALFSFPLKTNFQMSDSEFAQVAQAVKGR